MGRIMEGMQSLLRFLDVKQAAQFLGLARATLNKWRCLGVGPRFRRFGGRVKYAIEDLEAWAEAQRRDSTSDQGKAA